MTIDEIIDYANEKVYAHEEIGPIVASSIKTFFEMGLIDEERALALIESFEPDPAAEED